MGYMLYCLFLTVVITGCGRVGNHAFTEATTLTTVTLDTLVIALPSVSIFSTFTPVIIASKGWSRNIVFTQSTTLLTSLGYCFFITEVLCMLLTPCIFVVAGV